MRPSIPFRLPLLAAVFACGAAVALERGDFAWQWPLDTGGGDGLLALTLVPEVYQHASRADLRDLAVFNAAGEPVPFGPAAPPEQRARALQPEPVAVPMFVVPAPGAAGSGEAVSLQIVRDADGRLRSLDANVTPGTRAATGDLLLDLSALDRAVHGLALTLADGAGPLDARVSIEGSEDLGRWRRLAQGLALVRLDQGGFRLERTRLEFPATSLPYLRIRRSDSGAALPVTAVAAIPAPVEAGLVVPQRSWLELPGQPAGDPAAGSSAYRFRAAGPFPVTALDVALADRNSIADVVVSSRDGDQQPWRERARFTAFRLGDATTGVGNAVVETGLVRDRQWQVETRPAQPRAPRLRLGWRADRFLLLTQGEPPYLLAAGSGRAERPDYPVTMALAELQSRHGSDWTPPAATLGAGAALSGDAALAAERAVPMQRILLWTVLVGGALILIGMVVRLLRQAA